MCESNAFLNDNGQRKELMKDVARILFDGDSATLIGILGERMVLDNVRIVEANLMAHAIIFERV